MVEITVSHGATMTQREDEPRSISGPWQSSSVSEHMLYGKSAWILVPALPLANLMTLENCLIISSAPLSVNQDTDGTYLTMLL